MRKDMEWRRMAVKDVRMEKEKEWVEQVEEV